MNDDYYMTKIKILMDDTKHIHLNYVRLHNEVKRITRYLLFLWMIITLFTVIMLVNYYSLYNMVL